MSSSSSFSGVLPVSERPRFWDADEDAVVGEGRQAGGSRVAIGTGEARQAGGSRAANGTIRDWPRHESLDLEALGSKRRSSRLRPTIPDVEWMGKLLRACCVHFLGSGLGRISSYISFSE